MSDVPRCGIVEKSGIQEFEKLVYQTGEIQISVPDNCKVSIVRSLVPRNLERDLLKVYPTANYKATKGTYLGASKSQEGW